MEVTLFEDVILRGVIRLSLYFCIFAQIAQVAQPMWIALTGTLDNLGSNKKNIILKVVFRTQICIHTFDSYSVTFQIRFIYWI